MTARTCVVIAAHDAAGTLAQTLDSLLAQTDPHWQALVVDDGSSDETPRVIAAYAARDARIVGLHSSDDGACCGASAARNRGLSAARGHRVLFLDSDDWIDAAHLQSLNAALDAHPDAVAAYCNYQRVMPDGQLAPPRGDAQVADAPMAVFARTCGVTIHAVVVQREIAARVGGFDETLRTGEDWDLWQRVARTGGRWVHVDLALAFYRASEHSLSRDIARMLIDTTIVINRGHAQDDRLRHLDLAYPRGAPDAAGDAAARARAYFALWCAALDCGRGGDGAALMPHLADLPQDADQTPALVATMFDGVMVGLRAVPQQLAARWSAYGADMAALIDGFTRSWSDRDGGRRVQYAFERLVLQYDDLAQPRRLLLTHGLRVDLRRPVDATPPPGVDRLYVYLCDGADVLCLHESGVLGAVSARQWVELAIGRFGLRRVLRWCTPAVVRSLSPQRALAALHAVLAALRGERPPDRHWRAVVVGALRQGLCTAVGPTTAPGSHCAVLRDLQQVHAPAAASGPSAAETEPGAKAGATDDAAYWEALFQKPDPWNYGSTYEQEKYAQQLALLPKQPIGLALELACAEGRFTELLAPRVDRLVAADISATALQRAAQRCRSHNNIEFLRLDLARDPLPEGADLIVCSEVLYYLDGEAELARVARRLASSLRPGGRLVTAHAFVLKDDLSRTGFDWDNPYGARVIHDALCAVPQLAQEQSLCTELYRIDCFVRMAGDTVVPVAREITQHVTTALDPDVARHVVWGGAVSRRADVARSESVTRINVLAYHRVAEDGPPGLARYRVSPRAFDAQMSWLRRNGYHAIVSSELNWYLRERRPFNGRPVMITFDDAYQDFADAAWPVLQRHDLRAEVFVVTDLAGGHASWDGAFGESARLLAPPEIGGLAAQGVYFGSHLASHRRADGVSTHDLAQELLRSRAALSAWTGRVPLSLAAPFGCTDARLRQLAMECGYGVLFGTESAPVELTSDRMNLPRVEVRGDMELESFVACMAGCR
jgi:peptidoglycan/xylan/chitin deacetylase (PgdA/CDA1 family)/GT2 family glycosyltransferase